MFGKCSCKYRWIVLLGFPFDSVWAQVVEAHWMDEEVGGATILIVRDDTKLNLGLRNVARGTYNVYAILFLHM